jgi:hypothetical protein
VDQQPITPSSAISFIHANGSHFAAQTTDGDAGFIELCSPVGCERAENWHIE